MVKVSARRQFPRYGEAFFRIPALALTSADSVHPHRLLAFFDARPDFHDLPGPISVLTCSSDDLGISWTPYVPLISARDGWGFGDACPVALHDGGIICGYVASQGMNFWDDATAGNNWKLYVCLSEDTETWVHRDITAQLWTEETGNLFFASGNGIQLTTGSHRGRILLPMVERRVNSPEIKALIVFSDDGGATWQRGGTLLGGDESKLLELPHGDILMSSRAYPQRLWALSTDGGQTLTMRTLQVKDPGCNAGLAMYHGTLVLTSLDPPEESPEARPDQDLDPSRGKSHDQLQDWFSRKNLVVRLGTLPEPPTSPLDPAEISWGEPHVIDPGPAAYSVCATLGDRIAVMWETGQQSGGSRSPYGSIAFTTLE